MSCSEELDILRRLLAFLLKVFRSFWSFKTLVRNRDSDLDLAQMPGYGSRLIKPGSTARQSKTNSSFKKNTNNKYYVFERSFMFVTVSC